MILKKPYAFFIKMFKPIHLFLSFLIVYLIYLTSKILDFLSSYIHSDSNVVGQNLKIELINNFIYIIPAILIITCLIILGIMLKKKKPFLFYVIAILSSIVVIVLNVYSSNFLKILEENIVSIGSAKLIHDLVLINVIIEFFLFIFFIIRGMGLNFKKFDFDSELSKIEISESDQEEFEVDINFDLNLAKRKRKRKLRFLKYSYLENKFLINTIFVISFLSIGLLVGLIISKQKEIGKEGIVYSVDGVELKVNDAYVLNKGYKNNVLTNNNLVVVETEISSFFEDKILSLDDFKLSVNDDFSFKPVTNYSKYLLDLGNVYKETALTSDFKKFLFVFEIPEKYLKSDFVFTYYHNQKKSIKINPEVIEKNSKNEVKQIKEEISFKDVLGDIKFKINSFEINNKFLVQYNYCIKKDDCILSYEYLTPSIDENFDKTILKLDVEYKNKSDLSLKKFYNFFSNFANISYKIGDKWYSQSTKFEEIKSLKTKDSHVYIGINKEIVNATNIKLVFTIRNSNYEYILK